MTPVCAERLRPPPLPPRPRKDDDEEREPFPKAKSDPPPVLGIGLGVEVEDTAAPTPRSPGSDFDPRDLLIDSMKAELVTLRGILAERGPSSPSPTNDQAPASEPPSTQPPSTRPSERVRRSKARVALVWSLAVTFLPAIGAAVARRWPELAEPIDLGIQLAQKLGNNLGL